VKESAIESCLNRDKKITLRGFSIFMKEYMIGILLQFLSSTIVILATGNNSVLPSLIIILSGSPSAVVLKAESFTSLVQLKPGL